MAKKHTPLPWKVERPGMVSFVGLEQFIKDNDLLVISMPCPPFALGAAGALVTHQAFGKDVQKANAEFIVQAVNNFAALLEVCEAIEYWLSDLHPSKLPCCFPRERLHAAVKAAKLPAKEQAK